MNVILRVRRLLFGLLQFGGHALRVIHPRRQFLIKLAGRAVQNLLRRFLQSRLNLPHTVGDYLVRLAAHFLLLRRQQVVELLPRLAQSVLRRFLQLHPSLFSTMAFLLQPRAQRFDGRSGGINRFIQRRAQHLRLRGCIPFGLRQHAARCFIERRTQRRRARRSLLLGLGQRLARHFRQLFAQFLRRAGKRRFKFCIPLLRRYQSVGLRLFDAPAAHRLCRVFQVLAPLLQMILRGFRRRKNFQRRRGSFALPQRALHHFFDGLFQSQRCRLLRSLLRGLLCGMAHRLLHGVANFFVQLRSGVFACLARFLHNLFGAVRGLLHHFLHRRFRHAVHRNLDGLLDRVVQLRIQLLAHHRHLFGDRLFRAASQSLVQRVLRVGHHARHLFRQRCLGIRSHNSSRRCRHHVNLVVSRRARGGHGSRRRNSSLHRRSSRLRGRHRRRSRRIDLSSDWRWFRRRHWRRHRNLKWRRLDPFLRRCGSRYWWRANRRQRLRRNASHRFGRCRRVHYSGQVARRNVHARRPILRRKCNPPEIPGNFKLQSDLKKLAHRARPLHPYHSPLRMIWPALRARNIQRHHRILRNVMFRLILTSVAIHHHRRGALLEGLPERVGARHRNRYGLHNARAAALLCAGIGGL